MLSFVWGIGVDVGICCLFVICELLFVLFLVCWFDFVFLVCGFRGYFCCCVV